MGLMGLQTLELSGNALLVGPIPSTIGTMTRLAFLKLPSNGLTGQVPPTMLKGCPMLEMLDLQGALG